MKTIKMAIGAIAVGFIALNSMAAPSTWGPVTIKLQAEFQDKDFVTTSIHTNKTMAATNVITTFTSSATNSTIDDTALLKLLASSYSMTFPPGSKLAVDSCMDFAVVDSGYSNRVQDVSGVLSVTVYRNILTGTEIQTRKQPPGTIPSDLWNITQTQAITLTYDDSGLGGTNSFLVYGILTARGSGDFEKKTQTIDTFTGTGYSTVNGKSSILRGTMTATAPGVCD